MQEAGREVGRITLAELLALAQREAVIATDFRYAALLAPAGRYQRRAPICCDTADAEPLTQVLHAQYIERLQQNHPPSYHVVLRDATLFGQGAVVSAGGALLDDSCWEFFSQGGLPPGLTGAENRHYRLAKAPSRHIDRPSLLVKRPFWRNYGHWVMDGAALLTWLPRLQLPADCQLIVGPHEDAKMRAIMRETLDILAPDRPVIEQPDDEVWTVASLHYVTPPHIPPLTKQPAVMAALSGRLCALQPDVPATRRLYVTRDAGLGRRLVNEDQMIALCQHLGFEIVRPEQHSLREQVALFQSASCVLGVKGAALSNALFCSSAARLFVLSPPDWPDPFFWDLAAQRGMAYGEMFGPVHSDGERQSVHMFEIDIPRLARNLATFCEPTPAPGAPVVPAAVG